MRCRGGRGCRGCRRVAGRGVGGVAVAGGVAGVAVSRLPGVSPCRGCRGRRCHRRPALARRGARGMSDGAEGSMPSRPPSAPCGRCHRQYGPQLQAPRFPDPSSGRTDSATTPRDSRTPVDRQNGDAIDAWAGKRPLSDRQTTRGLRPIPRQPVKSRRRRCHRHSGRLDVHGTVRRRTSRGRRAAGRLPRAGRPAGHSPPPCRRALSPAPPLPGHFFPAAPHTSRRPPDAPRRPPHPALPARLHFPAHAPEPSPLPHVDIFHADAQLHEGSPLAVFPDAEGLSDDEMQALAREMNISETCFVLPPTDEGRRGRRLPRAHLHPGPRAALRRASRRSGRPGCLPTRVASPWAEPSIPRSPGGRHRRPAVADRRCDRPRGRASLPAAVTMTQGAPEISDRLRGGGDRRAVRGARGLGRIGSAGPSTAGGGAGHHRAALEPRASDRRLRRHGRRPPSSRPGFPHLIIPFADRAVMADVDRERREYVADLCQAYDCDSAALVGPGTSGTIADADVSVRIFDSDAFRDRSRPGDRCRGRADRDLSWAARRAAATRPTGW